MYLLKITTHSLSSPLIGDTAGLDLPQIKKTTKNRVMKKNVKQIALAITILFMSLTSFAQNNPKFKVTFEVQNITCFGQTDGIIKVFPSGGVAPYTVTWSDGSVSNVIMDLGPGYYEAIVVDATGMEIILSLQLDNPSPITVSSQVSDVTSIGASNGEIDLTLSGGTGNLNVLWGNGETSSSLQNLTSGSYDVTVTDENGCMVTESIVVGTTITPIRDNVFNGFSVNPNNDPTQIGTVYPNPSSGSVNFRFDEELIQRIRLYRSNGELVKDMNAQSWRNTYLEKGTYYVHYISQEKIEKRDVLIVK